MCAGACLVWVLLEFGNPDATTVIHEGSLVIPLLAVSACVAGAYAISARFGTALVAVNVCFVLVLYAPSLAPLSGTFYSPLAVLFALAALAGILRLTLSDRAEH